MVSHSPAGRSFEFADLFAGIGGFHAALAPLGGRCVYAVEIDPVAAVVYERNWAVPALGDITEHANDRAVTVPQHDVLVGGFPCQPFSKSGAQRGMDEARGTLFWNIARVIEARRPAVVILENVRNLAGPRHIHEWEVIVATLREIGYRVSSVPAVISPHQLPPWLGGRPQNRERVFITATRVDGGSWSLDAPAVCPPDHIDGWSPADWNLAEDLPLDPDECAEGFALNEYEKYWIDAWDDLVRVFLAARPGERLPGFPLWVDAWTTSASLEIPAGTPPWKANFLRKNAAFYTANQALLDAWIARWGLRTGKFPASRRKFEWQAQDAATLWECLMHLRPSGIRAKRPTYAPALVAITQTTIVGSRGRRLTPREAARLQGFPDWFDFGDQPISASYRQLGNAVNVGVVTHVLREHVRRDRDILAVTAPDLLAAIESSDGSTVDLSTAVERFVPAAAQ